MKLEIRLQKKIHKKNPIIIGLVVIVVVVVGAVAVKSVLLNDNTDIYGTWQQNIKDENSDSKRIHEYNFNDDGTGSYEDLLYDGGKISTNNKIDLKNIRIETINKDIDHIIFDDDIYDCFYTYKYKNKLGAFSETLVPKTKTFDLKIINDNDKSATIYRKDGTCHICFDYKNCENDDCGGYTFQYKRKGNIILRKGSQGRMELSYIVEGGILTVWYTKVDDN